jgi:HSP20 family molecular chaperone IbpA
MHYRVFILGLASALALPVLAQTPPPEVPVQAAPAPAASGPAAPIQAAPPVSPTPACPPCPCAETPYPQWMPPAFGQPPMGFFPGQPDFANAPGRSAPLRVERNATAEGYSVRIFLEGRTADTLRVTQEGRWLVIHSGQDDNQQYTSDQQGGYSFQRSYRSAQRRFTLPPDADISKLTRTDSEGLVELSIPRREW